ncbi:MAG: hypothetical protein LBO79_07395, partial [Zoogloeaceae bacterium]|nr:hypothetical protein [Zoogloeaceae bacterium]
IQHVEFRDDRFAVALSLNRDYGGANRKLFYRARVVTPGRFIFPPVYAEDMYFPSVYGLAEGVGSVTVSEHR